MARNAVSTATISVAATSIMSRRADESSGLGDVPELFSRRSWLEIGECVGLSPRQRQIARLMAMALTISDIANALRISPHTVRMHRRVLYEKLGVKTRVGLVVRLVLAERKIGNRPDPGP